MIDGPRAGSGPEEILRVALRQEMDPLPALAGFRLAQRRFHDAMIQDDPVTCCRGCSACCSQMVYDVHAVEIEDLGRHLRRTGRAAAVIAALHRRTDLYDAVRRQVERAHGESEDDWMERVALAFWLRADPCVFLDPDGSCSIHEHRPQSCRRYFVRGPAALCTPHTAWSPARRAFMAEPGVGNEVDVLLDRLSLRVPFEPEDDRLDHALLRWLEHRSEDA